VVDEEAEAVVGALTGAGVVAGVAADDEDGSAALASRGAKALSAAGARVLVPFRICALMFVDTFRINLPCTVSFPLDFFKSSVSISKNRRVGM
jgi:hypothetical protein